MPLKGNPKWTKGVSGNPKGGPKGPKRRTILQDQLNDKLKEVLSGKRQSPLAFLMSVYEDPKASMSSRMTAAQACLPYMHKKMPTDVAVSAHDPQELAQTMRALMDACDVPEERPDGME